MLIPLVCSQCGGKLEVENSQIAKAGDTVIVLSGQTFRCPHCGMEYLPGEKIKHVLEKAAISIGGNVSGSTIIIGNGIVINKSSSPAISQDGQEIKQTHSADLQAKMKADEQKTPKKWWQFWKV